MEAPALTIFYSDAYVASTHAFDTTRKAAWVAASLADSSTGVALVEPAWAARAALLRVHAPAYVDAVRTGAPLGLAESSGLAWNAGVWDAVRASTGGAVAAALAAWTSGANCGSLSSGLHHARRDHGEGFCTFNGLALAARTAVDAGAARVLVLDLDAHMGGGTFSLVAAWPEVWHLDLAVCPSVDRYDPHAHPRATLDIVSRAADYLPTLRQRLDEVTAVGFDLVIYNAGMDVEERCGLGGLRGITRDVIAEREETVMGWARAGGIPVAFVLAGGYTGPRLSRDELVGLHRLTIGAAGAEALA